MRFDDLPENYGQAEENMDLNNLKLEQLHQPNDDYDQMMEANLEQIEDNKKKVGRG